MSASPPASDPPAGQGGRTAAISVVGLGSQQIASLIITLLAAGVLGPAEYGVYAVAIVFAEFVIALTYTGFFHFLVTSDADDGAVASTMFWTMTAIGVAGGALLIVAAPALARVFDIPQLAPVLRLFGLLQPFAAMIGWASAALMRAGRMRRYFGVLSITNLGGLAAGAAILMVWPSLYALVAYRAIRIVLGLVAFGLSLPVRPGLRFDPALLRRAARYAAGLYGARMLSFLSQFGTDLALAFLFTTTEVGLYRFANRLATASVDIVGQPLRVFALGRFGRAARAGEPLGPVMTQALGATALLAGGLAATAALFAEPLVTLAFRAEYLAALGAFYVLALRAALLAVPQMVEPLLAATGRTGVAALHDLVWAGATVAAIALVAPFGLLPMAVALTGVAGAAATAAPWVMARWGRVDVLPGLVRAAQALALVAIYGATVGAGLAWLHRGGSVANSDPVADLILGFGLALLAGAAALALAVRARVIDLRLFEG